MKRNESARKQSVQRLPLLTDDDLHLFNQGTHYRLYRKLGAHIDSDGVHFSVWAPNAESVFVIGTFNAWDRNATPLEPVGSSGVWYGFVSGIGKGELYKFHIRSRHGGYTVDKTDPFAIHNEVAPKTASVVWDLDYEWNDATWMGDRKRHNALDAPISIYELHLGSWMRVPEQGNRSLTYRELAPKLVEHVSRLGFTHVEFLPLMEHPFFGSWGYQVTGYFAASSLYGTPQDLKYLIDYLHRHGVGVILDWVPAHFPTDEHGLGYFDGTHLFEHADPRQGFHPDWNSFIFNYGRDEVRSFLLSSALFWLDEFHIDGLRVDGVASMLYLDYSREAGQWIPNEHGGRENLAALQFLRTFNEVIYQQFPDVQTIAEESTAWPMVSRPTYLGGLGFGLKWDMGWMHDTLQHMSRDSVHRKWHHDELSFRAIYQFHENFVLPLSHDEVVHGKGSLLGKMSGDDWQKFANLRLLYAYMFAQPGKKLLFMGAELAQWHEWNHDGSLDWNLCDRPAHQQIGTLLSRLNELYRSRPALHQLDVDPAGFEWISNDPESNVMSFVRRGTESESRLIGVFNFTPMPRHNWRIGVDADGRWHEVLNTDAQEYGGSGQGNYGYRESTPIPWHGRPHSLNLTLPPLAALYFEPGRG